MHVRTRQSISFFVTVAALLAAALPVGAQVTHGVFVTPVPNAPFSATVHLERTQIQPDGSAVQLWSVREIARDDRGRIYNEFRPLVPASVKDVPPVTVIHLYDPQNRMTEYLYPANKTYRMMMLNRPPATDTTEDFASPTGAAAPANQFTHQDDLGYRTMEGLQVHGVRVTQTLPAAESGTGQDVVVTDEYWYSEALRVNLATKHDDPRTGSVTMTVTQISRTEPSAALFGVPADYTMAGLAAPAAGK